MQAAQETYNSHKESKGEKTFETLSIISGNFPQQAKRLSRVQVEKKLRKEVKENQADGEDTQWLSRHRRLHG